MKKSILSIIVVFALVAALFSGCSRIPKEPPETSLEEYTYENAVGETIIADDEYLEKYDTNVKYIKTVDNIELSLNSYYVYSKNAATMEVSNIYFDGTTAFRQGYVDITIIAIGKRADNMKIGYTTYDVNGNAINSSYILVKLDGVKRNETIEDCRFYFPKEAVRVVFQNYIESTDK